MTNEYPEDVRQYDSHPSSPFYEEGCATCGQLVEECDCNAQEEE